MKIQVSQDNKMKQGSAEVRISEEVPASTYDGTVLTIKTQKVDDMGLYNFRLLLRAVVRTAQTHRVESLTINFSELYKLALRAHVKTDTAKVCGDTLTMAELAEMLAYESVLADYNFNTYKTPPKNGFATVKTLTLALGDKLDASVVRSIKAHIKRGVTVAEIVNSARDVANTPAQDMTPQALAKVARAGAKEYGVKVKILNKKQLEAQKMGALLAVSRASAHEPQLIVLEYHGAKRKGTDLALVGKAITYDTGGLGLKPGEGMVDMHLDMSGGSMAMHAIFAAAALGVEKNLVAVIPACENAIGKDAYRNGDIITSMSGKTIEVRHTDAEGRLILADALTYAQRHHKPAHMIDIATLTGAAIGAIGQHASLIMSNTCKSRLPNKARKAGAETGTRVWQMPLWDVYKKYMESKVADISNISSSKWGGAVTAGIFLAAFIDDEQDWMHIDIAPRMESVSQDNLAHGATGEPIYLLARLAEMLD